MSYLVSYRDLSHSYGGNPLFTDISIGFFEKERVGLIGANGSGKSTFLKIVSGLLEPEAGERSEKKHVRVVYLEQSEEFDAEATVEDVLFASVRKDSVGETEAFSRAKKMIGKAGFPDGSVNVSTLSGGWRKRLAVAAAMVREPDLLLLDEPTNHLDLEGILWLEDMLSRADFSFVLVTHDRRFLENATDKIVELGRYYPDGYLKVDGNYARFKNEKDALLNNQLKRQDVLSNKMRRETEWLQRGPRARATKANFRIEAAGRLEEELKKVKNRNLLNKSVEIRFSSTDRRTKRLLEARNISREIDGKTLFSDLSIRLMAGTRLGLLGFNGTGKTTLMRILNGALQPDGGEIREADGLNVVMFDQNRRQLDPEQSLRQALSPRGDSVLFRGRSVHVVTWAKKFLFSPDQLDLPVKRLSGGEQARILIANLMRRPADVLLLDEPTNDLDIPSLEVLEESLKEFPGAIVLVSHDRYLVDEVSTTVFGLHGDGTAAGYADFDQWLAVVNKKMSQEKKGKGDVKIKSSANNSKPGKLSYKYQLELDRMEESISDAESLVDKLEQEIQLPEIINDSEIMQDRCNRLQEAQDRVEQLYDRWQELEEMKSQ